MKENNSLIENRTELNIVGYAINNNHWLYIVATITMYSLDFSRIFLEDMVNINQSIFFCLFNDIQSILIWTDSMVFLEL
jgi:hypothetical protein